MRATQITRSLRRPVISRDSRRSFHGWIFVLTILCMALASPGVQAQTGSAQLSGLVVDTSGARVVGANVVLTNEGTQVAHSAISNDSGAYTFSSIQPGAYRITAAKTGFSTSEVSGLVLQVGDIRSLTLTLRVGSAASTVTVAANAPLINTADSDVSQTINDHQVENLPLNGRNFLQLATLSQGAYSTGGGASSGFRPQLGNSDTGFAGGRYNSVDYLIDGMMNRDIVFGAPILFPSIAAIREFKVMSGTYSAEFGGSAQQVIVNIKSGTNLLHGSAYDFYRDGSFDATAFNMKPDGIHWQQFGFDLGGPAWIPHIYDGHNRTFFFANYEGLRQSRNLTGTVTVPDPTQLGGVFPATIIDPDTGIAFPNNTIPASRISAFAKTYNKFILPANSPGGIHIGTVPNPIVENQQNYRIDETLNQANSMFFRFSWSRYAGTSGGLSLTGNSGDVIYNADVNEYQGEWTHIFSPHVLNEFRLGYISTHNDSTAPTIDQADFNALGIQGAYAGITAFELPQVGFANSPISGGGTNYNYPTVDQGQYWEFSDSLIITHGKHVVNVGADVRRASRIYGKGANLGSYTFNGQNTGNSLADYLLGMPSTATLPQPTPLAPNANQIAFKYPHFTIGTYAQDQYKATQRLTVNVGLRYDFYSISKEQDGDWNWLDPTIQGGGLCIGNKKLEALGISNNLEHYCGRSTPNGAPKLVFAPRIGLAYAAGPHGNTAIRAGYGIFYDTPEENDDINISNVYPFFQLGNYVAVKGVNTINLANPFPVQSKLAPVTPAQLGFVFSAPKKRATYSSQYSLAIEQQLSHGTHLTVSYLGSHTVHLETRLNLGQAYYYDPQNPLPVSARLRFPNFGPTYFGQSYEQWANYNAATVKLTSQIKNLTFLSSFTWSRSMDAGSAAFGVGNDGNVSGWAGPMDAYNFERSYARSSFDINKRFVASAVFAMPFGRGQRFFSSAPRVVDEVVGGWQLGVIGNIQSGLPFNIAATDLDNMTDTFGQRADLVSNPRPSGFKHGRGQWFNANAFTQPAAGLFGTSGRNILLAPPLDDWSASLMKNFDIFERLKFQARGDFFNVFNHASLGPPNDNVSVGYPSQVPAGAPALGNFVGITPVQPLDPGRVIQIAGKFIW